MKKCRLNLFYCALTAALALLTGTGVGAQFGAVPLWTNFYAYELGAPGDATDPIDLAVDTSGNVFVTGRASGGFGTVKYSGAGVPLWTNRFKPGISSAGQAIAVDSNGNAFVTGSSYESGSGATLKYSGAGVPLWTNYLDALAAWSIAVDNNSGKVFVAGTTHVNEGPGGTNGDYITAAYSNTGVPLWTNYHNELNNLHDQVQSMAVDGSGNVLVTGTAAGSFATIKYSGGGVPLWTNRHAGDGALGDMVVDGGGNAFVAGFVWPSFCTTIKYSAAGVGLWTNFFDQGGIGVIHPLALDSSGNICVAASSFDSITGSNDFMTLKYSGAGVLLWSNRYNAPENLYDIARSIAVDASGNVFVHGESSYALTNDLGLDLFPINFATLAYSSGGVPLWTNRYAATGYAADLAVDGSGNVVVTGFSTPGGRQAYVTIKYSSTLPQLTLNRTATNTVVVSWSSLSTGFTLQQNTDITSPSSWSNVTAGVQDDGTTKTLIANPASGNRFYRLKKP